MKSFTETTLPNLFLNRVYKFNSKPFLHYKTGEGWKSYTWTEVGEKVEAIGRALLSYGLQKGSKVCLISENRPEWVMFDLAILSVGAVTVPVYFTSTIEQIDQIIQHSDAEMVIVSTGAFLEKIKKAGLNPKVKHWLCFEKTLEPSHCHSMQIILDRAKQIEVSAYYKTLSDVTPSDLATIVYTSGTTGDPKGVCLTHSNIVSNITASSRTIAIQNDDSSLSFLPLSHMFERTAGFFCFMYFGAAIYYAEDIHKIPENLLEVRPTVLIAVPRVLEKFYNKVFEAMDPKPALVKRIFQHSLKTESPFFLALYDKIFFKKIRGKMGGRIRFIVTGGAAVIPKIVRFFDRIKIPVLQGYGLTETSPVISVNRLHNNVVGSVGEVLDNLEVKLSDDDEILVKGPSIMQGYYKNDKATREVMTDDGFFKTGDIGQYDGKILKITDRKKELIVTSGGKKIAPQPIENELLHYPIIEQVCLVGEGMKTIGALIVPNQNYVMKTASHLGVQEDYSKALNNEKIISEIQKVIEKINSSLPSYEQIKNFKLISEPFSQEKDELTPTLKLKRKNIFEHYEKEIRNLFKNSPSDAAE